MTKITNSKVLILLIAAASVGVLGTISFSGTVNADEIMDNLNDDLRDVQAKAVPDWVDNNFKWYGEGKIGQSDLLNSLTYMLDNNLMHLSDKAAQEVNDLRNENKKLRMEQAELLSDVFNRSDEPLLSTDDQGRIKSQFNWDTQTEQESLNHLRKAYDLNPNLQTKVVQFDKDHDKWIDVLSIDWGSTSSKDCSAAEGSSDENSSCWIRVSQTHAGDPDRPFITGQVPNPASDRPTEEVAFYYNKISFAHDTVDDIMAKGGTTSAWKDGIDKLSSIHGDSTVDSVVDDLQGVVVLCSTAIDKEILKIQAEMSVLEEIRDRLPAELTVRSGSTVQYGESDLEFLHRHADRIGEKILSLQTGLDVLQEELATADSFSFSVEREMKESDEKGGTEDMNIGIGELQNTLEEQQKTIDSLIDKTSTMHADGEFWFTDLRPGT
jgi:hypothetical protein